MNSILSKNGLKYLTWALVVILIIFHAWSLGFYPLPWFDETFYASIARDFQHTGHFFPTNSPAIYHFHEVYSYGPVFFMLQAAAYCLLGFNSYVSRLQSFLLGLGMIFSFLQLYRLKGKGPVWIEYVLILGLFFDYTLFDSFHLGRMEPLVITLLNFSIYFQLKSLQTDEPKKQYRYAVYYGLLSLLAILSTPRAVVLLVPVGFLLLWRIAAKRKAALFIEAAIYGGIVLSGIAAWILYAFGSISSMNSYYEIVAETSNFWRPFTLREAIYVYQFPVFGAALFVFGLTILLLKRKAIDELTFHACVGIILFYALVTIFRPYGIYTVSLAYLLLAHNLRLLVNNGGVKQGWKTLGAFASWSLIIFMILVSGLKMAYIIDSSPGRNPKGITEFFKKNVPPNSKVVADDIYYYAVLKAGSQFSYNQYVNQFESVEKYNREIVNYDYLMVSDAKTKLDPDTTVTFYLKNAKLQLVAQFQPPVDPVSAFVNNWRWGLISFFTYNGKLYKRVK